VRRIILIGLIGIAAILALGASAVGREAVGNLAGVMLDSRGKAVEGATVLIQSSDGQHPHATHTDVNGHFEFDRYSAGQYDLRGDLYGVFTEWNRRVLIRAGKTTQVTLHLPVAVK
jgi:Carboxypeptidase regulatory-like domain